MQNKKTVTIHDVAKKAGVSISTVSRVLNGLDRVSPKTQETVRQAVKELNFVPNNIAKSMITKKTGMIAVVIPEMSNEFYIEVLIGADSVVKEKGYYLMIFSTDNSPEAEKKIAASAFEQMADGIIVIPTVQDLSIYGHFKGNIVLVDRYIPGKHYHSVVIDNFGGSLLMTQYLLGKGHQKIGLLSGDELFNHGQERRSGYLSALTASRLPLDMSLLYTGAWDEDCGYKGMAHMLNHPEKPTAVFCCNNLICMGAIQYCVDHGVAIGEDISLAGFDDHRMARLVNPGITVINRPTYEMGVCAANMLLDKDKGQTGFGQYAATVSLGVSLLERNSVKDIRKT